MKNLYKILCCALMLCSFAYSAALCVTIPQPPRQASEASGAAQERADEGPPPETQGFSTFQGLIAIVIGCSIGYIAQRHMQRKRWENPLRKKSRRAKK